MSSLPWQGIFLPFSLGSQGNQPTCSSHNAFPFTPLCPCPSFILCLIVHLLLLTWLLLSQFLLSRHSSGKPAKVLLSWRHVTSHRNCFHSLHYIVLASLLFSSSLPPDVCMLRQVTIFSFICHQIYSERLLSEHDRLGPWLHEVCISTVRVWWEEGAQRQ